MDLESAVVAFLSKRAISDERDLELRNRDMALREREMTLREALAGHVPPPPPLP